MSRATLNNGDTGLVARTAINANFAECFDTQNALKMGKRPIIGFAGDSIADAMSFYSSGTNSPLFHALMRLTRRDFYVDPTKATLDGGGGYNFGDPGSPSAHLLTAFEAEPAIITKLAAKAIKPDILFIQSIQNDSMANPKATLDTYVGNVTTFVAQALALGVKLVVIFPRPPYNGQIGDTVVQGHNHVNRRLEEFARITPGCVFVNYLPLVRAASSAAENNGASSVVAWKGVNGQFTADGVHFYEMAQRAIAPLLVPILEAWAPPAVPQADTFRDWEDSAWPYGNLLGRQGMCYNYAGVSGKLNGADNAAVATNWNLTTQNGITVTPTLTTGADGYPRQRLTFSGTATSEAVITFNTLFYGVGGEIAPAQWTMEALLDLAAVVGLKRWQFELQGLVDVFSSELTYVSSPVSESYFLRTLRDFPYENHGFSSKQVVLTLTFPTGSSPSGYVELGRVGLWRKS